ncbi:hypothetical protein L6164_003782 [Bauhinia variegata]|uniref:Uncharacterized protein n=1 Tax=Bauhinia variegata TaxID=167791 RepID=A0ACB9Q2K9_BAUVA|nr:hypothetical protein L6164_003782 [Bauhinia variegata]
MSPGDHSQKPHVVCIPFPAQGHINPIMQFAKILHRKGFYITFVNTEYNHKLYLSSLGPQFINGKPDFRFEAIPDGLPPAAEGFDATQNVPILCNSTRKTCYGPFKELLLKLQSSPDVPPITLILADGNIGFAVKVARDLGIPDAQFWTASACGFQAYAQYEELIQRGIVPFKVC